MLQQLPNLSSDAIVIVCVCVHCVVVTYIDNTILYYLCFAVFAPIHTCFVVLVLDCSFCVL